MSFMRRIRETIDESPTGIAQVGDMALFKRSDNGYQATINGKVYDVDEQQMQVEEYKSSIRKLSVKPLGGSH
jgi:hypothetical protein